MCANQKKDLKNNSVSFGCVFLEDPFVNKTAINFRPVLLFASKYGRDQSSCKDGFQQGASDLKSLTLCTLVSRQNSRKHAPGNASLKQAEQT